MFEPEVTYFILPYYDVYEKTGIITAEPHIVTASWIAGYFFVEHIFFLLFWEEYIRPMRERIKEKLRCKLKSILH